MDLNVLTLRHPITLLKLAFRKLLRLASERRISRSRVGSSPYAGKLGSTQSLIDVRTLIQQTPLDDLNRGAEAFFKDLADWNHHLAKPFSSVSDTPGLLINFAVALQGLQLAPGLRVLDFGAGSGWTSHYLTQLGCEVTVLDVSSTALRIAGELYERQPVFGDQPNPRFLQFDGRRIDLPDNSVERILCFDAFHHAPNPAEVLREFARVMMPGGIAAFSEPGPAHSETSHSQSEMRKYRVLENDVDIEAIWKAAREVGFKDLKLAAYNVPAHHVSLADYGDLLSGGETYLRWAESTRAFLHDVRSFFLVMEGEETSDSRRAVGLAATIEIGIPRTVSAGSRLPVHALITNTGLAVWLPSERVPGGVSLGCHLFNPAGELLKYEHHWQPLGSTRSIHPRQRVELNFELPDLPAGTFILEFDCVANQVAWFSQYGSPTQRVSVEIVTAI